MISKEKEKNIVTKINHVWVFSTLILHTLLILLRGYFLTPEYTLYPYLIKNGFLPYKDLVDQHFPALFGPFSFPSFLTNNPWPLLGLFVITLCLTDLFIYFSLINHKVKRPLVWTIFYIVSSVYFSGNILWIETFVNLLLSIFLLLSNSRKKQNLFISGILLSQVVLLRPTIAPALLFLIFCVSNISPLLILGGLTGLILPYLLVFKIGVIPEFYDLAFRFNQSVYVKEASLWPMRRQVLQVILWIVPAIIYFLKSKKYLPILILVFLCFLGYPRFGFEHLQPLLLVTVFLYAITKSKPSFVVYSYIFIFFCLNLISSVRHPYGNFYLTPDIVVNAQLIKNLPGREVYLLGPSDLLYQLSGKLPPNKTFVPSLPWYLHQPTYNQKVINSLMLSKAPVIIDINATVDEKNITSESGEIFEYIKMNYTNIEKIGSYQLYLPKL